MQLKCNRGREHRVFDHSEFAVIKADQKYVMGVLPCGAEWFLPNRTTLKAIAVQVSGFMQVSHSVLVSTPHVVAVSGNCKNRLIHTTVGAYRLSRVIPHAPFLAAVNAGDPLSAAA